MRLKKKKKLKRFLTINWKTDYNNLKENNCQNHLKLLRNKIVFIGLEIYENLIKNLSLFNRLYVIIKN
jgi:hypothetical protein